jgi:hypothetical protein
MYMHSPLRVRVCAMGTGGLFVAMRADAAHVGVIQQDALVPAAVWSVSAAWLLWMH